MQIYLSNHARQRMAERSITEDEVRSVLESHDLSRYSASKVSITYERAVTGRTICVATVPPGIDGIANPTYVVVIKSVWIK